VDLLANGIAIGFGVCFQVVHPILILSGKISHYLQFGKIMLKMKKMSNLTCF
jgi:hypothetical protein